MENQKSLRDQDNREAHKKAAPRGQTGSGDTNNFDANNTTPRKKYDYEKVLNHLLNIGSAVSIDLEKEYAIRYAPSVIQTIEKHGICINATTEKYKRKDGKISNLARYFIADGWKDRARVLLGEAQCGS